MTITDERRDVSEVDARQRARKRLQAKADLATHAVAYVVINALVVGIWWATSDGYFWPGWMIAAWGVGLILNGWDVYGRHPITESDVDAEVERQRG